MKITFQVLQDSEDIKNGMIQFSIAENQKSAYMYFTLKQWQDFKNAVNNLENAENHEDMANSLDSDNPLHSLYKDGDAIELIFGGLLCFEMNFQKSDRKLWRCLKKAINDFKPEPPISTEKMEKCRCQSCPSELISKCKRFEEKCEGDAFTECPACVALGDYVYSCETRGDPE